MENQITPPENSNQSAPSGANSSQNPKRPILLIVICILSFVGLGWAILQGLINIMVGKTTESFYSMYQSMMEKSINDMGDAPPMATAWLENIMNGVLGYVEHLSAINVANLICSILALAGVIMMWNLKKLGFVLYAVPKVFMLFFPLFLVGFNVFSTIVLSSGIVFTGAFIAMYAVNLKVMK